MKRMPGAMAIAAVVAIAVSPLWAITVRPKADLRIWQTALDPSAPLTWPWEGEADRANVTLSNRLTGVAASTAVTKAAGEKRGSLSLPPLPEGAEAFYAAELTLLAGGAEVIRYTADIAYVNGVANRAFDVQKVGTKAWRSVKRERLAAYDADWLDETANATSVTLSASPAAGGAAVLELDLPPKSGYVAIPALELNDYVFDLGFDSDPDVWEAALRCGVPGMALFFR